MCSQETEQIKFFQFWQKDETSTSPIPPETLSNNLQMISLQGAATLRKMLL